MATKKPPTTSDATREDLEVVLADLFRHVAMRAQGQEAKLPTRLRKLPELDTIHPEAAGALLAAGPLLASWVIAALDRAGYAVVPK